MTPERKLLKQKDPLLLDSNDWPVITLTQVEVLDEATHKHCSLLHADANNLLTIQGRLEKSKDNNKQLLNRKLLDSLPTTITIEHIPTFSYGQDDEGKALLWAAGESGWFQITPARAYEPIFKSDCEAVDILYFLVDLYQEFKGKHKQLSKVTVESIFQQYAEDPAHKCLKTAHAEAAFQRHRTFLLRTMREAKEGINWKHSALLPYLQAQEDATMTDSTSVHTPARQQVDPRSKHAGKGRSSLRPRALKNSGKGAANQATADEEDAIDSSIQFDAISPTSLKRKRSTGKSRAEVVKDEETESPPPSAEEPELEIPLPLKESKPTTASDIKRGRKPVLEVKRECLPSTKANGYGDTWTCTVDGCASKVYAASTVESRVLIEQHFQSHANDRQVQLDVVYKEERPYLPVSNLVNKIRELAAQQQTAPGKVAGLDWSFPKPIAQRY